MLRPALMAALALASAACGERPGAAAAGTQPYGPPPGALPAGLYSGPPLARLPDGVIVWNTGERATGEGETEAAGINADYRRLARVDGGLLACGLKDTETGYFSGLTGRRSCVVHAPGGRMREVLPRGRKGRRGFQDIAVLGSVLVGTSGDTVYIRELKTGRAVARLRTAGARQWLGLPGVMLAASPSVETGPAALVKTEAGLVHVRLLNHGRGWRVWSQTVTLANGAAKLGPPLSAPLSPEVRGIPGGLVLTGGGLDGRRFLLGRDHPGGFFLLELAGFPAEAVVRWSGAPPGFSDTDVEAVAENGVIGLGAHGPVGQAALIVDLRGREPVTRSLRPDRPACAVERHPDRPSITTVRFISGHGGLDTVTQWPGPRARCWSTQAVEP